MPVLKALGGIYLPVHICAPHISSPTTSPMIGEVRLQLPTHKIHQVLVRGLRAGDHS